MNRDEKVTYLFEQFNKLESATFENRLKWKQINPKKFTAIKDSFEISLQILSDNITSKTKFKVHKELLYCTYSNDEWQTCTPPDKLHFRIQIHDAINNSDSFAISWEENHGLASAVVRSQCQRLFCLVLRNIENREFDTLNSFTSIY